MNFQVQKDIQEVWLLGVRLYLTQELMEWWKVPLYDKRFEKMGWKYMTVIKTNYFRHFLHKIMNMYCIKKV